MTEFFTARNSKHLAAQIDRFNARRPGVDLVLNWGRQGDTGLWYAHGEYGHGLVTDLDFWGVVEYCNKTAEFALDCLDEIND